MKTLVGACIVGVVVVASCSDGGRREGAGLESTPLAERAAERRVAPAPAVSRAAAIAAVQDAAPAGYELAAATGEAGAFEGVLPAQGLALRASRRGVELGPRGAPSQIRLRLAAAGCSGQLREALAATPRAEHNRARYAHSLEDGREIEAWYVSGPLGLEQGFTLETDWSCTTTEISVAMDGATIEPGGTDGLVLASATGARYRYSELFAHDANGKELAARLALRDSGAIALVVETRGAAFPVVIDPLVATEEPSSSRATRPRATRSGSPSR